MRSAVHRRSPPGRHTPALLLLLLGFALHAVWTPVHVLLQHRLEVALAVAEDDHVHAPGLEVHSGGHHEHRGPGQHEGPAHPEDHVGDHLLDVLAVRTRPPNPSELLGSEEMRRLIGDAAERYDRVILDSPATLGLPDAKVISDLSEAIVMVVRADSTTEQDVETVLEILGRQRVLGMVLNGASVDQARYGYAAS